MKTVTFLIIMGIVSVGVGLGVAMNAPDNEEGREFATTLATLMLFVPFAAAIIYLGVV